MFLSSPTFCSILFSLWAPSCGLSVTPPVTLLTGFLGSGKTSAIQSLFENRDGLRIAVLVNDLSSLNIDASVLRRTTSPDDGFETVALSNGCACCGTGAAGLLPAVDRLRSSGRFDHVVVELSGAADPARVLARFAAAAPATTARGMRAERRARPWVVAVVDAPAFPALYHSVDVVGESVSMMEDVFEAGGGGGTAAPVDAIVELLVHQIEAADVLLLNKADRATAAEVRAAAAVCSALNDRGARCVTTTFGVDVRQGIVGVLPPATYANTAGPTPPTTIRAPAPAQQLFHSFVYSARRPFHAERLGALVDAWPLPAKDVLSLTDYSASPAAGVAGAASPLRRILRSKGVVWLDTHHEQRVGWSHAGRHFRLAPEQCWWAVLPDDAMRALLTGSGRRGGSVLDGGAPELSYYDLERQSFIDTDECIFGGMECRFGDRRQEILFIGAARDGRADEGAIRRRLDACLVTDAEMVDYENRWGGAEPSMSAWLSSEYLRRVSL